MLDTLEGNFCQKSPKSEKYENWIALFVFPTKKKLTPNLKL